MEDVYRGQQKRTILNDSEKRMTGGSIPDSDMLRDHLCRVLPTSFLDVSDGSPWVSQRQEQELLKRALATGPRDTHDQQRRSGNLARTTSAAAETGHVPDGSVKVSGGIESAARLYDLSVSVTRFIQSMRSRNYGEDDEIGLSELDDLNKAGCAMWHTCPYCQGNLLITRLAQHLERCAGHSSALPNSYVIARIEETSENRGL